LHFTGTTFQHYRVASFCRSGSTIGDSPPIRTNRRTSDRSRTDACPMTIARRHGRPPNVPLDAGPIM